MPHTFAAEKENPQKEEAAKDVRHLKSDIDIISSLPNLCQTQNKEGVTLHNNFIRKEFVQNHEFGLGRGLPTNRTRRCAMTSADSGKWFFVQNISMERMPPM